MTTTSVTCPFTGVCFGRIKNNCRILVEVDEKWKSCPFQKEKINVPRSVNNDSKRSNY